MHSTQTLSNYAFFGGTFDPIHLAHLKLINNVEQYTSFSRVIISPVARNNFKLNQAPASAEQRIEMIKLAILDYHDIYPSSKLELILDTEDAKKGGISYAYDAVLAIKEKYNIEGKLGYLIGDDILPTLYKWKNIDSLLEEVEFFCFTRDNFKQPKENFVKVNLISSPSYQLSSTQIRNGEKGLSRRVEEYVKAALLYRS